MGNRVYMNAVKLVGLNDSFEEDGSEGQYAFAIFDDFDSTYMVVGDKDDMIRFVANHVKEGDTEAATIIRGINADYGGIILQGLMDYVQESQQGLYFNGAWKEWTQIEAGFIVDEE